MTSDAFVGATPRAAAAVTHSFSIKFIPSSLLLLLLLLFLLLALIISSRKRFCLIVSFSPFSRSSAGAMQFAA